MGVSSWSAGAIVFAGNSSFVSTLAFRKWMQLDRSVADEARRTDRASASSSGAPERRPPLGDAHGLFAPVQARTLAPGIPIDRRVMDSDTWISKTRRPSAAGGKYGGAGYPLGRMTWVCGQTRRPQPAHDAATARQLQARFSGTEMPLPANKYIGRQAGRAAGET